MLSGIYMNARIQASTAEYCTVYEDLQLNVQWKPEYLCRKKTRTSREGAKFLIMASRGEAVGVCLRAGARRGGFAI